MSALATVDPSAEAATRAGVYRRGVKVTLRRTVGVAPLATAVSASLVASLESVTTDSEASRRDGYGAGQPGSITQDDRRVVLMAADLRARRFPLPVAKNDTLIVEATGDEFNVTRVDAFKRAIAGAIELIVTGVA